MSHSSPERAGSELSAAVPPFNALVLAGSFGWGRSRALGLPPRALAPIALRPLITYPLEWLTDAGAGAIAIFANGRSDLLRDVLGIRFRNAALDFRDDQMPRGPAGCVKDAAQTMPSGSIVVVEGATLPQVSLRALLDSHRTSGAAVTIAASARSSTDTELQPAGIYVIEPRALDYVPQTGFQDLKESLIPRLYRAGELVVVHQCTRASRRVVNLETYLAANFQIVEQLGQSRSGGSTESQRIIAAPSASVAKEALVVGPVVIGSGARIEAGALIVGPATIGHDVAIAAGAVVSRSVIGNRCRIGPGAIVDAAVIVEAAEVAANGRLYRSVQGHAPAPGGWRKWLRRSLDTSSVRPAGRGDAAVPALADMVIGHSPRLADR